MRSRSATVGGLGGELDHDVVALALVVDLVGEGALAPAVDGAGVPPVALRMTSSARSSTPLTAALSAVASKMTMTS